jgi:hypothetical protein
MPSPFPPHDSSPSQTQEAERLIARITLWAPMLAVLFSLSEVAFEPTAFATWLGDGRAFYCAGQAAARGLDPYDLTVITACGERLGAPMLPSFFYTPLALAIYVPLGWLPPILAAAVLTAAQAWALVIVSRFLAQGVQNYGLSLRAALALAPSLAYGVTLNLWLGQVNLIGAGLIAAAAMALAHQRDERAGLMIAVAAVLKPGFLLFLALPIGLLRWRAALTAVLALSVALSLALVLAPSGVWADHADIARRIVTEPLPDWMRNGNHAPAGPLSRFNPDPAFIWLWHSVVVMTLAAATTAATVLAWALPPKDRVMPVAACACALMFLAGPFSWWAHTPILWVALAAMAPAAVRQGLAWTVPLLALALLAPVELNDPPIAALSLYGTIVSAACWALAATLSVRQSAPRLISALAARRAAAPSAH